MGRATPSPAATWPHASPAPPPRIGSPQVTIQSPADVDALREVARLGSARGAVVGAGTIIAPEQVAVAVEAGAGYLVSPGLDPDVVRAAQDAGIHPAGRDEADLRERAADVAEPVRAEPLRREGLQPRQAEGHRPLHLRADLLAARRA